jgi:hypothetical protein
MLLRTLLGAALLLVPLGLPAQTAPPKNKPAPPPTGLKVLSTTIDPTSRSVIVKAQNVTNDKTIVGYALRFRDLDKDGKELSDTGAAIDHEVPDSENTAYFILP